MLMAAAKIVAPADPPIPQSNEGWVYPYETKAAAEDIKSSTLIILFSNMADLCQFYPNSFPPLMWENAKTQSLSRACKYKILNGTSYPIPYAP